MRFITNSARSLVSMLFFRTWVITGRSKNCDHDLTILFGGSHGGSEAQLKYIQKLMFAVEPEIQSLGRQPRWKVNSLSKKHGVQLAFFPGTAAMSRFSRRKNDFFIPWWVAGDVNTSIDYTKRPWKKNLESDLRKVRKFQYEFTATRDPKDLEHFFNSMYLPLIKNSHGEGALIRSFDEQLETLRSGGELLFTLRDGEPVAGSLITYAGGTARARTFGVKDAKYELLRDGVTAANYFGKIRHVNSKGYSTLHLGTCRAFLTDGVLNYKKKFGLRLIGHDRNGHFLRILQPSSCVKAFLENNPFIYLKDGELWGSVFEGSNELNSPELETRVSKLQITGLRGMDIFSMKTSLESIVSPVSSKYAST